MRLDAQLELFKAIGAKPNVASLNIVDVDVKTISHERQTTRNNVIAVLIHVVGVS